MLFRRLAEPVNALFDYFTAAATGCAAGAAGGALSLSKTKIATTFPSRFARIPISAFAALLPVWMTPISAGEQAFAVKNGPSALIKKLAVTGSDWRDAFTRSELRDSRS